MPASQHQSPKSDIEISQAAKKRLINDVAREPVRARNRRNGIGGPGALRALL